MPAAFVYQPPVRRFSMSMSMSHSKKSNLSPKEDNATLWAQINLDSRALASAYLSLPDPGVVTAIWTKRDPIARRKRHFLTTHLVGVGQTYLSSPAAELGSTTAATIYPSPSGRYYVRFVPRTPAGDSGLLAEVWAADGLQMVWPIPESVHRSVYSDEWFGGVAWSPDENMIAYIADLPHSDHSSKDSPALSAWAGPLRDEFHANARGPFGEAYVKRCSPALFIADVFTGRIVLAANVMSVHLGQPQWSCGNNPWIVCTARPVAKPEDPEPPAIPDDLGIRYCYNRPSSLVAFIAPTTIDDVAKLSDTCINITDSTDSVDFCCTSPRFSEDGRDLVYIAASRDGGSYVLPHNTTKILRYVQITEDNKFSKPQTLIPFSEKPSYSSFPGLYLHGLVRRPWLSDSKIALTTTWGCVDRVVVVSFGRQNGALEPSMDIRDCLADFTDALGASTTLLDTKDGSMLIGVTDASTQTCLAVVREDNDEDNKPMNNVMWVTRPSERASVLSTNVQAQHTATLVATRPYDVESFALAARLFDEEKDDFENSYQVLIVLPSETTWSGRAALAVFPHGGPHVASVANFSAATTALLTRGFAVLFVNYRGSTGLGQASLKSLLGRVGTQDVNEVVQATRWALSKKEWALDEERVVFVGGSHSGFLGAHSSLIPKLFKRTVLRNPVVNIASMVGATDIPDWCFAEAGLTSDSSRAFVPTPEQMTVMYKCSPVSRVAQAKQDGVYPRTLLQVGSGDKRVPPTQSLEWRRLLTATFGEGVVTIRWYEGCGHAIDDVPEGDDAWLQALNFVSEILEDNEAK